MREFDPPNKPGAPPRSLFDDDADESADFFDKPDGLLDELESIKDLLDSEFDEQSPSNIPLLEDLVVNLPQPALLDIGGIFEDEMEPEAPAMPSPAFQFPKFTLDVAISDDPLPEPEPIAGAVAAIAPVLAAATAKADAPVNSAVPSKAAAPSSNSAIPPLAAPSNAATIKSSVRPNYSRELLIQELVDEFIPQIEAALHERLGQLDDAALLILKNTD